MAAIPQPTSGFRLSPEQLRAWSLAEGSSNTAFAMGAGLLRRDPSTEALRRALRSLAERHEALRTAYRFAPGHRVPLQVVLDAPEAFTLHARDFSGLPAAGRRAAVRRFLAGRGALSLDSFPLFSADLATLGPGRHLLKLQLPVLSADEASFALLFGELSRLLSGGELPEPGVQPADYAEWRDELLRREDEEAGRARGFWRDEPSVPVTRHPLETAGTFAAARESATAGLDADESRALERAAKRLGVPEEAFCLAAAALLLSRTTGDETVGLGRVHDARAAVSLGAAVGLFSRVIPAAVPIREGETFAALAARVARVLERQERAAELHPGESFDGPIFSFSRGPTRVVACDARLTASAIQIGVARGAGTSVRLLFDPARLPRPVAGVMARGYAALLRAASASPDVPCAALGILGGRDRRTLVSLWTREVARPAAETVTARFERRAKEAPDGAAFVCGGERLTFAALNARANRIARLLRARGAAPDVPVALSFRPGADLVCALVGILKSGAPYLPLAPENPPERLRRQLASAGAALVVANSGEASAFGNGARVLRLDDAAGLLARESDEDLPPVAGPESLAYVVTTSGSTGLPRPVAVTHRSLLAYSESILDLVGSLAPGVRSWGTASSIAADLGNTAIFPALLGGGTLHLIPRDVATDPALFSETMRAEPIDVLKIVPSLYDALLGDPPSADALPRRVLILGGEPFPAALAHRLRAAAPSLAVVNHYGPTEATVGALVHVLGKEDAARSVPIGRPLPHARAYVLDARGEPAAPGTTGELLVGGEGVARGYLGMREETAERFIPDPFLPDERVYRTGDVVRLLPDGEIEFLGRSDDQVKVRGHRVEPAEIVRALSEHPAVKCAFVAPVSGRLAAWYVPRSASSRRELADFLAERLPEYMIPQDLVEVDAFPLLPSGKVDRRALPEPGRPDDAFVAPRDPVEASIAAIWADVFGLPRLSVTANFFELGGHSLLATQILSRMTRTLGRPLVPAVLFENPSIEAMAGALSRVPERSA